LNKHTITAISAAIALAMSASAMGSTTSDAQYKTAQESISARPGSDQAACKSMAGNANDVCMAEANGRESVATAKLEATRGNSEQHRQDVRIAEANAAFAIANEKCDDLAGNAQDVCRKEAKSAAVAAKSDAGRVKTTAAADATASGASSEAGKKAATEKRDAAYAVAKEKCGSLADEAKASCIQEAKVRHGQS